MNHSLNSGPKGASRDFGLGPGPGKGDKSRVSDLTRFKQQFEEVEMPRVPCDDDPTFKRTKRGFKKVYGKPAEKPDFAEAAPPLPNEAAPEL